MTCGNVLLGGYMCNRPAGHDGWHEVRIDRPWVPLEAAWTPDDNGRWPPPEIGHINVPLARVED